MTDVPKNPRNAWRIDPPEFARGKRPSRRTGNLRARPSVRENRGRELVGSPSASARLEGDASTLLERLDAHARSLGQALISRQAEIDRREAVVHARLADLESMRRELELWSDGERSELADRRASLEERTAQIEVDARARRRELDDRETSLAESLVAVERAQAKLIELQRRCEETMRRFDTADRTVGEATKAKTTGAAAVALRVVHGDAPTERAVDPTGQAPQPTLAPSSNVATNRKRPAAAGAAIASSDLIRLHEALLDKERFLADEARKFEKERKRFAELRMNWIAERLQRQDRLVEGEALRELRALRAELEQERLDRVQVQKRRHQRMQHLLEAIEDEVVRLDLAWASVPQR